MGVIVLKEKQGEIVLLEMRGVHKRFPGVYALRDVNFTLHAGEVHALLGENGAGKSTLIKILGGIYTIDEGDILIDGQQVAIHSVTDAQANRISIIHQELAQVPYMTVAENIFLGKEPTNWRGTLHRREMNRQAQALLDHYDLGIQADAQLGALTIAQRQMIEIIKAASFNARILVMDEPTSSLSEKEVEFLFSTIRRLKASGVGIIYISHRLSELFDISDRVTVIRDGQYIGTCVTKDTQAADLIAMMVGRELTNYYTRTINKPGEETLRVEHLSAGTLIRDVSFTLHRGEILGLAGLVGAGRSEVVRAIFGLDPIASGQVSVQGKPVHIKDPNDAMAHGIGLVPEDRKKEGLFLIKDVGFNLTLEVLRSFMNMGRVSARKETEIIDRFIRELSIKTPSPQQILGNLSGGNQQKVIIGRWLATQPDILILDEPTRGVDVGAKAEIYAIMNELAQKGVSIIMISSELPEIINMSDRVVVMGDGRVKGELPREELSQEKIMFLATEGM